MKKTLIILSLLFITSHLFAQSKRPETIIVPVTSLGDVSEVRKQILQNTLTDELKKHFRIVPQEKYEQVLEQVFEELEYEECSEDTCIMRVQEILQVENVFNLQILGEGDDTQLNLNWITLDEKKNETELCSGCGTVELNGKVLGLIGRLVGEKPVVVRKKKGILFRDTPYSKFVEGGKKWFKTGDEKTQVKYEGDIENGVPNGSGITTFNGRKFFEGEFKDGLQNGQGRLTKPNGDKYLGEWKDAEKDGNGTETYANGNKYVGEFKDDKRNGQGTFTYTDGDKYVGEFKDDKRNGQGTFTWADGRKYVGGWKNDARWNGREYNNYGRYIGSYVNGKYIRQ